MLLLHIQGMCTLTDSVTVALLCCQTNCYFRNNSITHGLHTYWIDSGQDNSWVMCIRGSLSQHFLDSFHQAVYQTVQNLTTRWVTHTDVELQSQDVFFRGSLCKHRDSSKSLGRLSVTLFWDLQVALRFLTPPSYRSVCVSSTYLRQAPWSGARWRENSSQSLSQPQHKQQSLKKNLWTVCRVKRLKWIDLDSHNFQGCVRAVQVLLAEDPKHIQSAISTIIKQRRLKKQEEL